MSYLADEQVRVAIISTNHVDARNSFMLVTCRGTYVIEARLQFSLKTTAPGIL